MVTSPTHFSYLGSPSIIDLAFLSRPQNLISCCTIPPLFKSDHLGLSIICKLTTQFKRRKTPRRSVWCYTSGDFQKANELLENVNWTNLLSDDDIDMCWNKRHDQFLNVMEQCISRKLIPRRKNLLWINRSLIMAIRRRNSLFKKYKVTGLESVLVEYKFVWNRMTSELHKAKQRFFNRLHHSDPKTFWKLYNTLTRKETNIPALKRPTSTGMAVDSSKKANLFNAQFFLNFNSNNVSLFTSKELLNFNLESSNMPGDLLCLEEEILLYLRDLDVKKFSCVDGISAVMLKHTAFVIAPSQKRLFNLSITFGKFPSD